MPESPAPADLRAFLAEQSLFADMSPWDLDSLIGLSRVVSIAAGARLFGEDELGEAMYVVLDGKIEITRSVDGRTDLLATRGVGEVIGEMSMVTAEARVASATAVEPTRVLEIGHEAFRTLVTCSMTAAMTIMNTMARRLRTTEAALQEQERLASLGTMAAGLAHELNNPAAAIVRSSEQLAEIHEASSRAQFAFMEAMGHDARAGAALHTHLDRVRGRRAGAEGANRADGGTGTEGENHAEDEIGTEAAKGMRTRPAVQNAWEAEDAVRDALQRAGVGRAWELAPALARWGFGAEDVLALLNAYPEHARASAATFVAMSLEGETLVHDIATAARAISQIVHAVKSYSFLDQAPVQDLDLHVGLDDTLAILRHKLKQGVTVERLYAADLPRIEAYGSQLNQVWTNLIDNAVDAMGGVGSLRIRTHAGRTHVSVEICDDGPGMPPEVADRAFDLFFTTKGVGKGTGLGLHTVHGIVTRHRGTVELRPNPDGRGTCACVQLPRTMVDPGAAP